MVSSDLSRAAETAATLAGLLGIPLREDPRLREHGLGCWEGLTRAEVADRYPDQYADWLAGRPVRGRGGEEPAQVAERALAALADLPPARVAVVVTHGGTAGRLVERLLGLGPDHRRVFGSLANCAWSELAAQGPQWRLLRHNSSVLALPDGHVAAPRRAPHRPSPPRTRPFPGSGPRPRSATPTRSADRRRPSGTAARRTRVRSGTGTAG